MCEFKTLCMNHIFHIILFIIIFFLMNIMLLTQKEMITNAFAQHLVLIYYTFITISPN